MTEKENKAASYFAQGYYCSQAVLGAFCEKYGMQPELAFKISCGLNSGCRCADICGAVSGALLVVGLKYGDTQEICNTKTEEYIKRFKAQNKSVLCRQLLGCDISTPEGKAEFLQKNLFHTTCAELVKRAAALLEELGY